MGSEDTLLALIDLIYKAAGDSEQWATVLERLVRVLHAKVGTIHHQDSNSQESNFSTLWNLSPESVEPYTTYYGYHNPFMTTRPQIIRTGAVNTLEMLCPKQLLVRSEFYGDYLRHLDLLYCVAATLRNDGDSSSNLSIFRSPRDEPFGESERKFLLALMPHLQRAFQLHTRIQGLERKAEAAADVLEQLPYGVVLLDASCRTLLVNRAAAALFHTTKSLQLTSRGLIAMAYVENKRLQSLIHGVIQARNGDARHSGGGITISRGSHQRPLSLLVTPLRTQSLHIGKCIPVMAIFLSDPDSKPLPMTELFAQLYGLTRAEARLAHELVCGFSLKEASEHLGVMPSTLRSHLKSIFAKTNTARQSDLIRLLLLTPSRQA
jgi:DNA-binding CsgD family transcriptional regulator/PAS domain-containing protein